MIEVKESTDVVDELTCSWLMIAKTLKGYVVYQEHPTFTHHDRTPRPLYVFNTKAELLAWMAGKWMPKPPEHEYKCL